MLAKRTNGVKKRLLASAGVWIVVGLSAVLLLGQVHADEPAEAAADETQQLEPLSIQSIQTFHFKEDMTLKKALKQLSVQFQKNIVPSEKVNIDGRITVRDLYEVTFEEYDALLLPAAQIPPFATEIDWIREINGVSLETYIDWMAICCMITVTGCPAISVPGGFTEDGLPVGLQIVGKPRGDLDLLKIANAFEEATNFYRHPPLLTAD